VRAYTTLMRDGTPGSVYNVCSGAAHSMQEVVDLLVELSGTPTRVEVDAERFRPADLPLLLGDNTRLRALGWAPEFSIRQTLADLLEWHAGQLGDPAQAAA
jgi:GDP-4-dehydro-6-deoxy-D-mannose reductase